MSELSTVRYALRLCRRRVLKAEKLLEWVKAECDLSGQMELDQAITAFQEER